MTARAILQWTGILGALAVGLGAFGAHGLRARFAGMAESGERLAWWHTASQYHFIHVLLMALCGVVLLHLEARAPGVSIALAPTTLAPTTLAPTTLAQTTLAQTTLAQTTLRRAVAFDLAGMFFFCGSLYAMTLTGIRVLGAITPIGGLCFIVAWLLVAWAARQM